MSENRGVCADCLHCSRGTTSNANDATCWRVHEYVGLPIGRLCIQERTWAMESPANCGAVGKFFQKK